MSAAATGVCRTCRRGIFHDGNTWLHEYRAAAFDHPAEPRVDPEGPECAGRVAERKRGEQMSRMLDAAGFPGGAPGTWVTLGTKEPYIQQ